MRGDASDPTLGGMAKRFPPVAPSDELESEESSAPVEPSEDPEEESTSSSDLPAPKKGNLSGLQRWAKKFGK